MGRAERVVDKNIGKGRELLGKLGVVLRLALFKAGILEQHDLAVFQGSGQRLRALAHNVGSHLHGLAQKLRQTLCYDFQGQLRLYLTLGLSHMRAENDARAVLDEILNRRQRCDNALVARDLAVLCGDVEVAAAKHALAGYVDVFYRFLVVIHRDSSLYTLYTKPYQSNPRA